RAIRVEQLVFAHPFVVVHLRQIALARIGKPHDHHRVRVVDAPSHVKRYMDHEPARSADEESLLSRQPSRHGERFLVTHGHEVVDQPHVERPRALVLTEPLHLVPNTFRFSLTLGPPHLGEDRPHRITGDDLDLWVLLFEISAEPGDRSARAVCLPVPRSVRPEPWWYTKCVTRPSVGSEISGPVVS